MRNNMKIIFPAIPENESLARTVCAAFVLELDPTVEEMSEIRTAVSEAVTNSVIHGYNGSGGDIEIDAELDGRTVTYTIKDNGCGIENIEKAKEPLYTGSSDSERSGMGFSIMEAFMDKLEVESMPGEGTVVKLVKKIEADDE
ncbi:MAG: anti-sigma F factor [Clostridiales bacterium]|nr:anti-sigma F factor [Clostridiales bacterium]